VAARTSSDVGDLLDRARRGIDLEGSAAVTDDASLAAADNELVKLVNKIIIDAYQQGASDIHIEPFPGQGQDRDPLPQGRLAGALHRGAGQLPQCAGGAPQDHVRSRHLRARKPQDGKIKFKKFGPLDIELRVATMPSPAASKTS
jgi:type II secretory ATPase GspE/PulE/Tfp pilus assembly ATPase PilB-like protein